MSNYRARHVLSDFDAISPPKGMEFKAPWSHEKVFLALVVKKNQKHKELWKKNIYVQLYPQVSNCAVLYGPRVRNQGSGPLHLNDQRGAWDHSFFEKIRQCTAKVGRDNKGPGKERQEFDWYRVDDWDEFAQALGLGD